MTAVVLQVVGLVVLAAGVWWVSPPAALIVVGVLIGLLGAVMERDNLKKPGG